VTDTFLKAKSSLGLSLAGSETGRDVNGAGADADANGGSGGSWDIARNRVYLLHLCRCETEIEEGVEERFCGGRGETCGFFSFS